MPIVYAKTAKGAEEYLNRAHRLHPRLRTVLILVDGQRSDVHLVQMLPHAAEGIVMLLEGGFIQPLPGLDAMPGSERPGSERQAGLAANGRQSLAPRFDADDTLPPELGEDEMNGWATTLAPWEAGSETGPELAADPARAEDQSRAEAGWAANGHALSSHRPDKGTWAVTAWPAPVAPEPVAPLKPSALAKPAVPTNGNPPALANGPFNVATPPVALQPLATSDAPLNASISTEKLEQAIHLPAQATAAPPLAPVAAVVEAAAQARSTQPPNAVGYFTLRSHRNVASAAPSQAISALAQAQAAQTAQAAQVQTVQAHANSARGGEPSLIDSAPLESQPTIEPASLDFRRSMNGPLNGFATTSRDGPELSTKAAAQAPPAVSFSHLVPYPRFERQLQELVRLFKEQCGPAGDLVALKMQSAKDAKQLRPHLREAALLVDRLRGRDEAEVFAQHAERF